MKIFNCKFEIKHAAPAEESRADNFVCALRRIGPAPRGQGCPRSFPGRSLHAGWVGFGPMLVISLAALGSGAVLFLFDPSRCGFYPFCLFHRTTGLLCPGCGALRALHSLLHGRIGAALHYNALLVLSMPWIGWLALRQVRAKIKGEPAPVLMRPAWLWWGLGVLIIFGVLRNLPFAQQFWLAP